MSTRLPTERELEPITPSLASAVHSSSFQVAVDVQDENRQLKNKPDEKNRFKQQKLPYWRPAYTPTSVIITLALLGSISIAIGVPAYLTSADLVEYTIPYYPDSSACQSVGSGYIDCNVQLTQTMKAPVYFYYYLTRFYQTYRTYLTSRNNGQLNGAADPGMPGPCNQYANIPGRPESCSSTNQSNCLAPCGLTALSVFNDTFEVLQRSGPNSTQFTPVQFTQQGIAWSSDESNLFANQPRCTTQLPNGTSVFNFNPSIGCWEDMRNESFIVWMRNAGLPTFRKLNMIIQQDLTPGWYSIRILDRYPVGEFGGQKKVVLATTAWIGGKNDAIGLVYIIVGSVCFALAIAFAIKEIFFPGHPGDATDFLKADVVPTAPAEVAE